MDDSLKLAEPSSAAFAGAVSGCVTRLLFQPLDVVKTRFQVNITFCSFKTLVLVYNFYACILTVNSMSSIFKFFLFELILMLFCRFQFKLYKNHV